MSKEDEIKTLKKLSRYRKQQKITHKLDFQNLWQLNPYPRLMAMKQLLGMFDSRYIVMSYYKSDTENKAYYEFHKKQYEEFGIQKEIPFREIPDIEEVERLLFSCSIQYYQETMRLMARYKELLAVKGEKDGISV